jgi:hypothetical protein
MSHKCVSDEQVASDVEQYGLSVMLVEEGEECPRFAYSVGLYHNFNHPEIVVFGLNLQVAGRVINELARRIKAGRPCQIGKKYRGLLEGYSCLFREVSQGCYSEYFGYALSFYNGPNFSALQLVWPDKQRRWPWDLDFNPSWISLQPLLEHWPEEKVKSHWVFAGPRNLGVFTTTRVLKDGFPILQVFHDQDGDWQFLCGLTNKNSHVKLVCLKDVVELDASVNELADLPAGWHASREHKDAAWRREPLDQQPEES